MRTAFRLQSLAYVTSTVVHSYSACLYKYTFCANYRNLLLAVKIEINAEIFNIQFPIYLVHIYYDFIEMDFFYLVIVRTANSAQISV